ncbi:MAG: SpoIIE family protein phosphatase [Rhodanobacter sp.]
MDNRQLHQDILEKLLATVSTLAANADIGAALAELAESARLQTGASSAALWQHDVATGELTLLVPSRNPPPRLHAGAGLAGRCAADGHMLLELEPGPTVDIIALVTAAPDHVGAVLNLPLLAGDAVLGVLQLLCDSDASFGPGEVLLARVMAAQGAQAWQLAQLAASTRKTRELDSEVGVAREIQRSTLPQWMPEVPGYDLHGHFQPAAYAGGDLFDAVRLEHGVFLLLGDATGHGFGPALSATQMQGMLRVAFRLGADLDNAYLHVNNQLAEDLPADRFITAFMGFLDPDAHSVRYHAAGQGPILHFHAAEGRCEWQQPSTFPVGVLELAQVMAATTLQLAPGDILGLISDGLYERTNPDGAEFGQDRVGAIVQRRHASSMSNLCQELLTAAEKFAAGGVQEDDVTMVLVRRMS